MKNNIQNPKIKKNLKDEIFLILTSIQTGLMGILFIIQVLRIYFGNNKTFTREICKDYILQILPAIIIWIALIIISFIYYYIRGSKKESFSKISNITKLRNLENIFPVHSKNENFGSENINSDENSNNELINDLNIQKNKRKKLFIVVIVIILICSGMSIGYLVNPKHFDSNGDITKQIGSMSIYLLPWVIISFVSLIAFSIYEEINAKKSIKIIQNIIKMNNKKIDKQTNSEIGNNSSEIDNKSSNAFINIFFKNRKLIIQAFLFLLAISLIVVGLIDNQDSSILKKAITICNECIGLG